MIIGILIGSLILSVEYSTIDGNESTYMSTMKYSLHSHFTSYLQLFLKLNVLNNIYIF